MKAFEIFYLSYYFLVRKDKYLSKTGRVRFLIELVLLMLCSSMLFMFFGALDIRTNSFKSILMLIFLALISTHLISKVVLERSKEQKYIQSGKDFDLRKKRSYALLGLLGLLISFVIMVLSAILMSYLWSCDLF
jgi:hypothetical protein